MRNIKSTILILIALFAFSAVHAQNINDVLNLLVQKGTITEAEADSIRADDALKQQQAKPKQPVYPVNALVPFQLNGYTQVRYQYSQQNIPAGFDIRRARLDVRGAFGSQWDYRLQVDFVGNKGATGSAATGGAYLSPMLLDAYAAYKPW